MSLPKVFVARRIPAKGIEMLERAAKLDVWEDELPPSREVLLEKVRGVDGLVSLVTDKIDGEVMDAAGSSLKVIGQYAVGYDNIDVAAATSRRIAVGNTPGVLTETTADFAFALLMAAARRVVEGDKFTRAGFWKTWGPSLLLGHDVFGATLGIIGFGRIGQAVARRARGFSMRILYTDSIAYPQAENELGATRVSLDELLHESDYVSLHTNLCKETYHLIGAAELAKMKKTAILINTSRGPILDEIALYEALSNGKIAYAGLDVTEKEPIPMDSPLLKLDNIMIAPHIASASVQSRTKMATITAENVIAGLQGKRLPFCVNPELYSA